MIDQASDRLHSALLALLRSGLWEREVDDLSPFPLPRVLWECVYQLARCQTVTGLVFRGIQYLPDELLPHESLLVQWAAETDAIERKNREMNRVLSGLCSLFHSIGLHPVLQKGQGVAHFYDKPLLRECGDIDLYFAGNDAWTAANSAMASRGARLRELSDKSVYYMWQGIKIEHHSRLFDLHNPFLRGYAARLERDKGFDRLVLDGFPGSELTVPSPFLNLMLLDLHILKHALGWGIGLRQLCDMARACHCLSAGIEPDEMRAVSRRLGITRWDAMLHACLTGSLGLREQCLPYPVSAPTAQPLLDIVWRGGNFGYRLQSRGQSGQSSWRSKLRTARSFRHNLRFAVSYAPKEAFWLVARLLKGQF